jgi:bisphosphoglycerate-independent phosphoglycerate mutase (AlkP superfamily)
MKKKIIGKNKFLAMLVLDGLGIAADSDGNAVFKAKMTNWHELLLKYPSASLQPVFAKDGRNIFQEYSYAVLGGNSSENNKSDNSVLRILSSKGFNSSVLAEPNRLPLSVFFLGEDPLCGSGFFSPIKKNSDNSELSSFRIVAKELLKRIKSREYNFIIAFTSAVEVIARKGDVQTTILALEEIDKTIKRVSEAVLEADGRLLILATNGGAEEIVDMKTEKINKSISSNSVPFILVDKDLEGKTLDFPEALGCDLSVCQSIGDIKSISPTILSLFGIAPGDYYKEKSLI